MNRFVYQNLLCFAGVVGTLGCALTNKADPLNVRYFTPYVPEATQPGVRTSREPVTVRVDRVEAAAHLTESIAFRKSRTELMYHPELRWTETPDVYLERAIGDALFTDGSLRRGITEGAFTLGVVLEEFEALDFAQPRARVVARVWIADDRRVTSERRLVIEELVEQTNGSADEQHDRLMQAFARALTNTASAIKAELVTAIENQASQPPEVGMGAPTEETDPTLEN